MISLYRLLGKIPYFVTQSELVGGNSHVGIIVGECAPAGARNRLSANVFAYSLNGEKLNIDDLSSELSSKIDQFSTEEIQFTHAGIVKSCGEKYGFIRDFSDVDRYFHLDNVETFGSSPPSRGDFVYFSLGDDGNVFSFLVIPGPHRGEIIGFTNSGHAIVKHLWCGATFIHKIRKGEELHANRTVTFFPNIFVDREKKKISFTCVIKEMVAPNVSRSANGP